MDKNKLFKLAKLLVKFASVATDKAELVYEGELAEGIEVYVEVEGEYVPAEDGEYLTEDKKIVVAEGKVTAVEEIVADPEPEAEPVEVVVEAEVEPVVEEPAPAPVEDEKDLRIAELEDALAQRDTHIQELEDRIKELEDQAAAPVEEPVNMNKVTPTEKKAKDNPALRFF